VKRLFLLNGLPSLFLPAGDNRNCGAITLTVTVHRQA
ncbi:uncharacterized protein METZ01_LOCUS497435, partial [marine metagenome]